MGLWALNKHDQETHAWRRIVKTMLAEKAGKQLPRAMGYLGLAWGLVRRCTLNVRDTCRGNVDLACSFSCRVFLYMLLKSCMT